ARPMTGRNAGLRVATGSPPHRRPPLACGRANAPRRRRSAAKSGNVHPRRGAGDDEALDLGGALEERVDLRVAVPPLHREVADVAVATEDLDGLLGHPARALARLELAHRAFAVLERLLRRAHPRRPPDEQACGV